MYRKFCLKMFKKINFKAVLKKVFHFLKKTWSNSSYSLSIISWTKQYKKCFIWTSFRMCALWRSLPTFRLISNPISGKTSPISTRHTSGNQFNYDLGRESLKSIIKQNILCNNTNNYFSSKSLELIV